MAVPQWPGRGRSWQTVDWSESAGPFAPFEGTARVKVGPGEEPKRLDDGGSALKTWISWSEENRTDGATLKGGVGGRPEDSVGRLTAMDSGGRASVVGSGPELADDGSESAGPFAPGEGTAQVQVGPGVSPKRIGRRWQRLEDSVGPVCGHWAVACD